MSLLRRLPRGPLPLLGALLLVTLLLGAGACAAGNPRFTPEEPAGFFMGLWHGAIAVVTLVIGIFDDTIGVYERNNGGGWYDFGFILALTSVWGHSHHVARKRRRSHADAERAAAIGRAIGEEIERELRKWAEAEPDEDWDAVGHKLEQKLEQKLHEWSSKR
ncbi:MAG: hypothetical protein KDK70_18315 [Myxococcales bacterium]|nr:hypothetical protein [Myxococcales bacterium]